MESPRLRPDRRGRKAARDPGTSAGSEEVRQWLLKLMRSGRSHNYANQALSALRFFHKAVLKEPAPVAGIPRPKRKKALPKVLPKKEVKRFLGNLKKPKYRAIAFVLYSGGLRVSEAARLKVSDIDGESGQPLGSSRRVTERTDTSRRDPSK